MSSLIKTDPKANQKIVYQEALKVFGGNVLMAEVTLAQAILESNLLGVPSQLALKYNNLFGIKGKGTKGSVKLDTREETKDGKSYYVKADFQWNTSIEDSIAQRKRLLENGTRDFPTRYHPVLKATTFEQAAKALVAGGYATDGSYAKKLIQVYEKYIKGRY